MVVLYRFRHHLDSLSELVDILFTFRLAEANSNGNGVDIPVSMWRGVLEVATSLYMRRAGPELIDARRARGGLLF